MLANPARRKSADARVADGRVGVGLVPGADALEIFGDGLVRA
jgi:hypothetical protein